MKWPRRSIKPRLLGCGYAARQRSEVSVGDLTPGKLLAKRIPPTVRMDEKCQGKRQATSRSCGDRVTPVSQYAGALWETSCGCVLYSSSGRFAITVPRHNRDIMVPSAHWSAGRAGNETPGVFTASRLAYARNVPYHKAASAQRKRMCFAVIITAWHLNGVSRNQVGRR